MSNQGKDEIVIPPRYETLGRARPRGNPNNHGYPQNVNPFQRVPHSPSQIRQTYQQPINSRSSVMSTSGINYSSNNYSMGYGTVSRQNTQNSYRQPAPSPSMNPVNRQPLRTNRQMSGSSNSPGFYPVIPTRDISRQQTSSSTIYRHTPNSSISSFKSISNDSNNNFISRSNTTATDITYRKHQPKNSISSLFTEEANKIIEEPVIPLRGKGSLTSINKITNIPPRSTNDLSSRTRSPSLPTVEVSQVHHHIRSQSYSNVLVNNALANGKIRSNSSGNVGNNIASSLANSSLINGRQTKSEDNVASKAQPLKKPSLVESTPILGSHDEYDSPVESPDIRNLPYSPDLANEDSFISQGSPIIVPTSPIEDNDNKSVAFPPRRGYKTQSIYSNFSVMTTSGEVMEYQGIQSLDAIEEMLKNDAFNSKALYNDLNNCQQLITQPIIEKPPAPAPAPTPAIVIPTRTSASIHPKSSTPSATENETTPIKEESSNNNNNNNDNSNSTENVSEEEEIGIINHSALLSEIAKEFLNSIPLVKKTKDSIEYTESFNGADAVDTIASVIGTKNRKLALAIGRSLESQLLFHDVLYTNNLMDSQEYIYQLQARSTMRYNRDSRLDISAIIGDYIETSNPMINDEKKELTPGHSQNNSNDDLYSNSHTDLPSGVFVAISSCYSPTCTKDSPCYSYSCPNRKAFNLKSTVKDSKHNLSSLAESNDNAWSTTVGKNVLEKVDDHERKRQEVIYEFIQSEKEYVDDLISVIKLIKRPLSEGAVPKIDNGFVNIVFSNIEEVLSCNAPFSQALQNMQQKNSIIDRLGDITMEFVKTFTSYIRYGEIQPLAKEVLQYNRNINSSLENFLKQMQSKKEFRRLPLESFLARPTTRLGRYPILIKDILKHTKEDHPDQKTLKETMEIIQNILKQVNEKAGKTTNKIKLDQWAKSLDQTTMEKIEDILGLRLNSPKREFLREGSLLLKREGTTPQEVDIVFLDNAFVITRKKVNTIEILKKPIPVQLIKLVNHEEQDELNNKNLPFNEKRYTFSIVHMGLKTYTFMTKVYSEKKSWVETIEERLKQVQGSYIELFNIFSCHLKINTAVVVKDDIMIFANDSGLYTNVGNTLTMILPLQRITTIDIMPDAGLLFVLIDKEVIPYSIDALLKGSLVSNFKKPRKLCSGITFMKIGFCDGHHLLCAVKTANTNSTVRSYEPNQPLINAISTGVYKKSVSTIDVLIPHKQFYIPAEAKSIQFLKRALCVGCTKGFEVVNINTLTTQSLFDTHNPNYEWIIKAEYNPIKLIKTVKGDFLVCYNKVGFFLDKNGNPSRNNTRFFWLNPANSFAYISPYILAVSDNYVEVWDEYEPDTVKQIIYGYNIRLFTSYTADAVYIISGNDMHLISRIILSRKRMH